MSVSMLLCTPLQLRAAGELAVRRTLQAARWVDESLLKVRLRVVQVR
jgi:hypothetical protein